MARKILITGGAGFIGTNLIKTLHQSPTDDLITVIDNECLGNLSLLKPYGVNGIKADILDAEVMKQALDGIEVVIHLAADTRVIDSIENPRHNFEINVVGSFQLLELAKEAGVKKLITASTGGAILGEAEPPIHENLPANPLSPYGASKLAIEGYCSAFSGAYGMETVSLRFSNIYGPHSAHKGSVVAAFMRSILKGEELVVYGDGTQVRDYLFVEDLMKGILKSMDLPVTGPYQLANGTPMALNQLIATLEEVTGPNFQLHTRYETPRDGEIHTTWCDISKAQADLGFTPQTTLKDGLQATWDWFYNFYEGER